MSYICFIVRSSVFLMECQVSEQFFPMNTADSNVTDMNMPHITECFSWFSVTFIEDRFCPSRTWSLTLSKKGLDPNDKSYSVSSSPMMNCCGPSSKITCLVFSWEKFDWNSCVLAPVATTGVPFLSSINSSAFHSLRRPSFVIVPPWVAWWVRAINKLFVVMHWLVTCVTADNGLLRSIISLSFRTPGLWLS